MTDRTPDPRDASPDTGKTRAVPPLAWIIGAVLVLLVVIAFVQYDGSFTTPRGGVAPVTKSEGVVPAEALPARP